MGVRAHGSHLARQDTEGHGGNAPRGQVLGGAQGRDRETPGSPVRELRGGACATVAELGLWEAKVDQKGGVARDDGEKDAGKAAASSTSFEFQAPNSGSLTEKQCSPGCMATGTRATAPKHLAH